VRDNGTTAVSYRDRVRGCLLGGAIGGALGVPVEYDSMETIRRIHGAAGVTGLTPGRHGGTGLVTGGTQMTAFTAEGLIRAGVRARERGFAAPVDVVRNAYLRWLDTQDHSLPPPPDGLVRTGHLREQLWLYARRTPGDTCLSALRGGHAPGGSAPLTVPGEPGPVNSTSKDCGAVLRSAPFGLAARDAGDAFTLAVGCARITHGHPTGHLAAGAFAALIFHISQDVPLPSAVPDVLTLLGEHPSHEETTAAVEAALILTAMGTPTPEKVERLGGGRTAEEAFAIALYCALAAGDDVERALLLAVNHSGDSASTAAICGNIVGTRHGHTALPTRWLTSLEGRDTLTELADDLSTHTTGGPTARDKYPGC
jgi:ADP-ribosylglycohydrolase